MTARNKLKITREEVTQNFSDVVWATKFPPILTVNQASEMLQISKSTLYQWRSEGKLSGCTQRLGKHLRFLRDRLFLTAMNKGL